MIKLEKTEVVGWEPAIRGMRNPLNSWMKSDSLFFDDGEGHVCKIGEGDGLDLIEVGHNDHKLMMSLAKGGPVHAKYRRMINVYVDITAPLYWYKEFDTYKIGTVANSCSTMHKIHEKMFTPDDFSHEHLINYEEGLKDDFLCYTPGDRFAPEGVMCLVINMLNHARQKYLDAKTKPMKDESKRAEVMKKYWWQMIQLLPSSYNQKRTVMLNYEVLNNIYHSRKNHKLDEWHVFCDWIKSLPYSELIIGESETGNETDNH